MTNSITNSQNNKCPHGYPIGACPICSSMKGGSVSKDKNKPRKPGEMSYNECLAQWRRMQRAKEAKIQAKIDHAMLIKQNAAKTRALLGIGEFSKNFQKIFKTAADFINKNLTVPIKSSLAQIGAFAHKTAMNIAGGIKTIYVNLINFAVSAGEKLVCVIGETKNFINSFFQESSDKAKKAIKTILLLFMEFEQKEEEKKEKEKLEKIKKIVKKMFKKKKKRERQKR